MATEYLREKINLLRSQVVNDEVELFAQELVVKDAEVPTGDKAVDRDMKALASNAKTVSLRLKRRITVRNEILQRLEAELEEHEKEQAAAEPEA